MRLYSPETNTEKDVQTKYLDQIKERIESGALDTETRTLYEMFLHTATAQLEAVGKSMKDSDRPWRFYSRRILKLVA